MIEGVVGVNSPHIQMSIGIHGVNIYVKEILIFKRIIKHLDLAQITIVLIRVARLIQF